MSGFEWTECKYCGLPLEECECCGKDNEDIEYSEEYDYTQDKD